MGDGLLSEKTIKSLNDRLNDSAETTRQDAAIEFFKLLDKNPQLADDPTYKPYVDAFIEKILKDPNAVVRQAAELALQTGKIKQPTQPVLDELQKITQGSGIYNMEPGIASDILTQLSTNANTPGQAADTDLQQAQANTAVPQPDPKAKAGAGQNSPAQPAAPFNSVTPGAPGPQAQAGNLPAGMQELMANLGQGPQAAASWAGPQAQAQAFQQSNPAGQRLDLLSAPQSGAMPGFQPGGTAGQGQRLNIQEGPRS